MGEKETFLISLSEKVFPHLWKEGFGSLSQPEQVFVCVWELESEVNNGGFHQFFFNSAGDHACETIAALEEIGAPYTAGLLRQASAVFPAAQPPGDRDARQDLLLAMGEAEEQKLHELDKLFYEYKESPSELLYTFVQQHRAEIRGG